MFGLDDIIAGSIKFVDDAMNLAFPSPEAKASAQAKLLQATADNFVQQTKAAQAVMLAEEQSADPWTSRARPSFLYVIYLLILMAIPMGILSAFKPDTATAIITGFHGWLAALPDGLLQLFGFGYCGYTASRTAEKHLDLKAKINGVK